MSTFSRVARSASWRFSFSLFTPDAATGVDGPYVGAAVSAWLSATDGGATMGTTTNLTEESGNPGTYAGAMTKAQVASDLVASGVADGATVYEVCQLPDGSRLSNPLTVVAAARMRIAR